MEIKRGCVVTVALQGDYEKPRPALIVQTDVLKTASVVVLPITGHLIDAEQIWIDIKASKSTGLMKDSQIMVDKPSTRHREKIGSIVGTIQKKDMQKIESALVFLMGIGS